LIRIPALEVSFVSLYKIANFNIPLSEFRT
jgi:hypothetical protein